MAKIFEITAILRNRGITRYNPTTTTYLNTKRVEKVVSTVYENNSGVTAIGSQINYSGFDNTFIDEIICTEPVSTISSRMNAANTTDVHKIDLNIIDAFAPATGYVAPNFLTAVAVNVEDIWQIIQNPLNSDNAQIWIQSPERSMIDQYRVVETAVSIANAANA